jgi:hypothetical protein
MYGVGHLSSTCNSKCFICNKRTGTFVDYSNFDKSGNKSGIELSIPVCEDHYRQIADQKEKFKSIITIANQLISKEG